MAVSKRARDRSLQHRLVWQAASLLLAYPDDRHHDRLADVDQLCEHLTGEPGTLLARAVQTLRQWDTQTAATTFVDTFDLARRTTMYLTYWTAGDTRNRGQAMHTFIAAYRGAGAEPPKDEAPDYLPVVLEFAAVVDPVAGGRLLAEHRVPVEVLRHALTAIGSPYADVVAAVCATLPAATEDDVRRA